MPSFRNAARAAGDLRNRRALTRHGRPDVAELASVYVGLRDAIVTNCQCRAARGRAAMSIPTQRSRAVSQWSLCMRASWSLLSPRDDHDRGLGVAEQGLQGRAVADAPVRGAVAADHGPGH